MGVACSTQVREFVKVLVGILERRTPLGTPKFRYEDNIKKDLKRIRKRVRCIHIRNLLYSLVGCDVAYSSRS
jgi:hypothetical protein